MKFFNELLPRKLTQVFLIIFLLTFSPGEINSAKTELGLGIPPPSGTPWCWTKPQNNNPEFQITPKGGLNWGMLPQGNTQSAKINYTVEMRTSMREKSGTSSKVFIKLFGTQGASSRMLLSDKILEVGSITSQSFTYRDLGQLYKIELSIKGPLPFRPYKVKIFSGNGTEYSFENLKMIRPCNQRDYISCKVEIKEEGNITYDVEIKTKDDDSAERRGPILITLLGTNGVSFEKSWNELGAKRGTSETVQIKTGDIGDVVGFKLRISTRGQWEPSLVNIVNNITNERKSFPLEKSKMFVPGKPLFEFNFVLPKSQAAADAMNDEEYNVFGGGSGASYDKKWQASLPNGGGFFGDKLQDEYNRMVNLDHNSGVGSEGRTQVGALTAAGERAKMISMSCTEKLNNDLRNFGPDFAGGKVNFESILVKCPVGCDKYSDSVYGVGIHPNSTPVCLAALVDKAMPPAGGLIAVNIYPALSKYDLPPGFTKIGKIGLKSYYELAKKSYTLAKVDNVDMVEKDFRIVDSKGNISNEGRLEIRQDGYWGTVCFKDMAKPSADRICKDLEFITGEWKNPSFEETSGFCRTFKGEDHCGSDYTMPFFWKLHCDPGVQTFNDCDKKPANVKSCNHGLDAIISCSNNDLGADAAESPTDGINGVIRLSSGREIDGELIGRLEVYENQKWGGACDIGFSNDSGDVSCRQMGFDTGRWYNSQDSKEWKLDAKDNSAFTASNIECTGQEATIKDCNYIKDNIACDHTHDVILACKGAGDASGQNQIKPKVVTPTPDLGRLGMSYIRINCATTGKDRRFRGDPGSVFIIECQPGCDKQRGSTTGTGVYTSDSSVCISACHAGIFPCEAGGEGVLVKTFGQKYYESSISHGIQSAERLVETDVSFTFTRKWSNYQIYSNLLLNNNLSSVNHQNVMQRNFLDRIMNGASDRLNTILTGSVQERMDYHKNQATSYSASFNIGGMSLDAQIPDSFKVDIGGANLIGGLSPISFLELNQSMGSSLGPVAFKWSESIGTHRFDAMGKIMKRGRPMKALEKMYSMFAAFNMDFFENDDEYLFSYGGCGGFNIWIDTGNSINLGDPCDGNKRIDTGFKVPKKDKVYLYIGYDNSKLKVRFKEKNNFSSVKQRDFEFKLTIPEQENLCIGCRSADQGKPFFGGIDFIIFYDALVPEFAIGTVIREIEDEKKASDNVNNYPITEDGRKCVSSPMLAPTPGQPGAPTPPPTANPYVGADSPQNVPLENTPDSFMPGVYHTQPPNDDFKNFSLLETNSGHKGLWDSIKKGANKVKDWLFGGKKKNGGGSSGDENNAGPDSQSSDEANIGSIKVDCETTAMEGKFFNKKGKIFRISCGSCANARYPVIGSGNYHPKSSICRAAIHARVLKVGQKADIVMVIGEGFAAYNGEIGGGEIKSLSIGKEDFSFRVKEAPPLKVIKCLTRGNEDDFAVAKKDSKFLVVCPKYCAKQKYKASIFGSDYYADISPICLSAYHHGIIGDTGGNVEFMFTDGLQEYKGTQGFALKSKSLGPQLRSFIFLGNKSAIFYSFKETYDQNIKNFWEQLDERNSIYKNKNAWRYYNKPDWLNSERKTESMHAIAHEGEIKTKTEGIQYASVMKFINQQADWANGVIRVNMMFFTVTSGRAAMMFRYQDNDNHFGIVFDMYEKDDKIIVYKKVEGSVTLATRKKMDLRIGVWYRVAIFLDYNNIKITIQQEKIRQHIVIFDGPITGIQRGTMALGVDYMRRVFFAGIEVDKWTPDSLRDPAEKRMRGPVDEIMKRLTFDKRLRKCRSLYRKNVSEVNRCVEPHIYCKLSCDEHIHPKENISNYFCYKSCIDTINQSKKKSPFGSNAWDPKLGEKVDYFKADENMYVMAKIKQIKNDPAGGDDKIITVDYTTPDGIEATSEDRWNQTAKSIVKCGKELTGRTDCLKKETF